MCVEVYGLANATGGAHYVGRLCIVSLLDYIEAERRNFQTAHFVGVAGVSTGSGRLSLVHASSCSGNWQRQVSSIGAGDTISRSLARYPTSVDKTKM